MKDTFDSTGQAVFTPRIAKTNLKLILTGHYLRYLLMGLEKGSFALFPSILHLKTSRGNAYDLFLPLFDFPRDLNVPIPLAAA